MMYLTEKNTKRGKSFFEGFYYHAMENIDPKALMAPIN